MTGDRPPNPSATEDPPADASVAAAVPGGTPPPEAAAEPEATSEAPADADPPPKDDAVAAAAPAGAPPEADEPLKDDAVAAAAPGDATPPEAADAAVLAAAQTAPVPKAKPGPKPKRPPRPREPLPWPELRAAAGMVRDAADVDELKELFKLLPGDVRDETIEGVREYRKGARRPVSAYAGKSLARAVHTARRARRRPDSDDAVSEAIGQALAAEIIASLDVEVAAEVILPKRDLLDRESRNARRRQKVEDDKARDEKRRLAREQSGQQGGTFGTYSGAKIRGLDELAKLFEEEQKQ